MKDLFSNDYSWWYFKYYETDFSFHIYSNERDRFFLFSLLSNFVTPVQSSDDDRYGWETVYKCSKFDLVDYYNQHNGSFVFDKSRNYYDWNHLVYGFKTTDDTLHKLKPLSNDVERIDNIDRITKVYGRHNGNTVHADFKFSTQTSHAFWVCKQQEWTTSLEPNLVNHGSKEDRNKYKT